MFENPFADLIRAAEPQHPGYVPNPVAARILSRLIETGLAPSPLPDGLPPEWVYAYAAVMDVAATDQVKRWQAFVEAVHGFPVDMILEVNAAAEHALDRSFKDRILYKTVDALQDPPALEWCVDRLFVRPSLNLLVGDPGAKKTYLAIDLAVCVATGKPWLGHPVKPCPVLFIDEESGLYQIWGRLNAAFRAHQVQSDAPFSYVSLGGYDLRNPRDADALTERAQSLNAGLIVIDALANLMRSSENNLASVQPVLFNLRRLADYCRAAVVVIHHTNRHGVFRGSSSISAAMDLMLSLSSAPDSDLIQLRSLKARFFAPPTFCARAFFGTTPAGQPLFHLEPTGEIPAPAMDPVVSGPQRSLTIGILEFLSTHPGATREQVTSHLNGFSENSIRITLFELLSSGQIKRTNPGSKGTKASYALSD
ncbi:MAG: AAA family ATPase [Anaerolineales bacterium]